MFWTSFSEGTEIWDTSGKGDESAGEIFLPFEPVISTTIAAASPEFTWLEVGKPTLGDNFLRMLDWPKYNKLNFLTQCVDISTSKYL